MPKTGKPKGRPKKVKDEEIAEQLKKSPIMFIKGCWGLVPQPAKEGKEGVVEYLISKNKWDEIKPEFFVPFLKGKHITWQQWLILRAVEKGLAGDKRRISVASGHGIGKSGCLAWLILWFLFCFKDAQIPCTAPTGDQMYDVLWKELSKWLSRMPQAVQNKYEWQSNYIRIKDYVGSEKVWWARAKTARKESPEALAGIHGDYVMMCVDEASAVDDAIFSTGEGALTRQDILVIMISNPTRTDGYFADSHNPERDKDAWQTLQFSSIDSPIVDQPYVDRIIQKYGIESDEYRIKVLGKFPLVEAMDDKGWVSIIQDSQIIRGSSEAEFVGQVKLGIDPAGEGDDMTVWTARDAFNAKVIAREQISNPKSIAEKTMTLMDYYNISPTNVVIDNFGVGANVSQELALAGQRVDAINSGSDADDDEIYLNKRAEMFFRLRQWLIMGGMVCDDKMKKEISMIKYIRNLSGKKQIMKKKDMIKLMKKSPDEVDALSLTFYNLDADYEDTIQETEVLINRQNYGRTY